MNAILSAEDFTAFFAEIHLQSPFPWQRRLAAKVAETGRWPEVLDLPTGFGKTAALDIAVFHLALEADRGPARRAAVRIVLAVDRRLVVDDAFDRAECIAAALNPDSPRGPATRLVAERLGRLSGTGKPLVVRRLRGGIPREDDWARTPCQPTILCSTVDQVGSRLLFRGYGLSDRAKPIYAGLVGSDCLILLDEAHLSQPFRQTLDWVARYRGPDWREDRAGAAPWGVTFLTATPSHESESRFAAEAEDREDPMLSARWHASKPSRLVLPSAGASREAPERAADGPGAVPGRGSPEERGRVAAIVTEVRRAFCALREGGVTAPAVAVVVNRVFRARAVHLALGQDEDIDAGAPLLLVGPARPVDRQDMADELEPIRTRPIPRGRRRELERPLLLVATQCIEVGVDVDLDGLITDLAPLDALRQRFGRLNRAGREITPYAAVITSRAEVATRADDPVYGASLGAAWEYLNGVANAPVRRGESRTVDFGLAAFQTVMDRQPLPRTALAPAEDAPVLLPAHLDLLSQTAPIPSADPEVALYLHGPRRQPESISLVWRADIDPGGNPSDVRRLLSLVPPRAGEAVQLPFWAVRNWLTRQGTLEGLADVAERPSDEGDSPRWPPGSQRQVFCWTGSADTSDWIPPDRVRPGDTIVVPSSYGGVDSFGWNPDSHGPADDVAAKAARPYRGRHFAVRLAPGLAGEIGAELSDALAAVATRSWREVQEALLKLDLPSEVRDDLTSLDSAKGGRRRVVMDLQAYGVDDGGRPRGVVFVAPFGLKDVTPSDGMQPPATEDDAAGSWTGVAVPLDSHCRRVGDQAGEFARCTGLSEARARDLRLAGYLHDRGKEDPRFQVLLAFGDPLGPDPGYLLAKSAQLAPWGTAERVGLPPHWRHEAASVRVAMLDSRLSGADDPELVLWLIGTHHGWGRPFFPDAPETEAGGAKNPRSPLEPVPDPRSLAFDWRGMGWSDLYGRLKIRYGTWDLARLEAILRLADHRVSEDERRSAEGDDA